MSEKTEEGTCRGELIERECECGEAFYRTAVLEELAQSSPPTGVTTARENELVPWGDERPKTRGDCIGRPRPCPWVGCRYNLMLEVGPSGALRPMSGYRNDRDPRNPRVVDRRDRAVTLLGQRRGRLVPKMGAERMERVVDELADRLVEWFTSVDQPSCALDVSDQGGRTLKDVGEALGVTRERARQVEHQALRRVLRRVRIEGRKGRLKDWRSGT